MKQIYFLFILFLTPFSLHAQEAPGLVTGKLVYQNGSPVSYATVTLVRADRSVAGGDLTGDDGLFRIQGTGFGTFDLLISGIGLEGQQIDGLVLSMETPVRNMGSIAVVSRTQSLDEVEVTAEKALFVMDVDKKVFQVDKNITTEGGSASDVLQNVPSLSVDVEGNVSLRGRSNATILIDGKPATLLGGDEASALQSLPASSIDRVEVITNPSARYDAQGLTGIINIVTKKDRRMGLNGMASLGAGTGDKYNGSLNLNLRNEKWNFFLNSSFRQNRRQNYSEMVRTDLSGAEYQTIEDGIRNFRGFFNSLGAEYSLSEKTTIGLRQNLNWMRWSGKSQSNLDRFPAGSHQSRYSEYSGGPFSYSTTLDFKQLMSRPQEEIVGSFTYTRFQVEREQLFITQDWDADDELIAPGLIKDAPGSGGSWNFTGSIDYTLPFTENRRMDAGVKSQINGFDSKNDPIRIQGNEVRVDSVQLIDYDYSQQIHAAYLNLRDQIEKFRYQIGLRSEYVIYEGSLRSLSSDRYFYDYLGLFPSAFVSYELPKDQSIFLNYSRRTDRPHFMQLMPFRNLSNPQEISTGNPDLIPEFIHHIEFSYNRLFEAGHNLIFSTYYQYTQNIIERYRESLGGGVYLSKPYNLHAGTTYGVELISKLQFNKIWDGMISANMFRNTIDGRNIDADLYTEGFGWFAKMNSNLRLPAGFAFQVDANYQAPRVIAQGTRDGVYWIDMALRKNLMKNKATLVFNVSDIFNTRKYTSHYDFGTSVQRRYRDRETRIGNISFSYRFGRSDIRPRRRQPSELAPGVQDRDNIRTEEVNDTGGF